MSNKSYDPDPRVEIDPLLRLPQVLQLIPVSRSTWWKWVKDGKAPKGIKIGDRVTAWRQSDVKELMTGDWQ